jgi:hypothetical protein
MPPGIIDTVLKAVKVLNLNSVVLGEALIKQFR